MKIKIMPIISVIHKAKVIFIMTVLVSVIDVENDWKFNVSNEKIATKIPIILRTLEYIL